MCVHVHLCARLALWTRTHKVLPLLFALINDRCRVMTNNAAENVCPADATISRIRATPFGPRPLLSGPFNLIPTVSPPITISLPRALSSRRSFLPAHWNLLPAARPRATAAAREISHFVSSSFSAVCVKFASVVSISFFFYFFIFFVNLQLYLAREQNVTEHSEHYCIKRERVMKISMVIER